MRYKILGKSGLKVSVVGLGTWAIGGDFWGESDNKESVYAIQKGIDEGINLIDTAPIYGRGLSEEMVGNAIKGRRDNLVIATKCGLVWGARSGKCLKADSIRKEAEDSCRRLGVDSIDLYQIHWPDANTPVEETMGELNRLKEKGIIKNIGVSNFDVPLLQEALKYGEIASIQPQYSMIWRKEQEVLDFCHKNNIGALTYGSIGGGLLSGKIGKDYKPAKGDNRSNFYEFFKEPLFSKCLKLVELLKQIANEKGCTTTQVAINWVAQRDFVTCALVGCRNEKQAAENADMARWELTLDEIKKIDDFYENLMR